MAEGACDAPAQLLSWLMAAIGGQKVQAVELNPYRAVMIPPAPTDEHSTNIGMYYLGQYLGDRTAAEKYLKFEGSNNGGNEQRE